MKFTISFGSSEMECSVWSSARAARAAVPANLEIVNEYGSGPVYVFAQAGAVGETVPSRAVGILMDSEYESPTILGLEWGGMRWVGGNSHVYRISPDIVIRQEIVLDSRFASFRLFRRLDRLIVLAEAGIFSLRSSGETDWRVDLDVIADASWEDESVVLSQLEGTPLRVHLESGIVATSE